MVLNYVKYLNSYQHVDLKFNILWFLTAVAYWLGPILRHLDQGCIAWHRHKTTIVSPLNSKLLTEYWVQQQEMCLIRLQGW